MRITLNSDTTFYVDSLNGSDLTGDGLTRLTAFKTPQHARDTVYKTYDCNLYSVTFFYVNSGVPYGGVIAAYPLLGLGHDYGESYRGELDANGSIAVLVQDNIAGCFHLAGGAQAYIYNMGMSSTNGVPCVVAAYQGLAALNRVVLYSAQNAPLINAGPSCGRIDILNEWWVINAGIAGNALLNATDRSYITVPVEAPCTLYGSPIFTFSTAAVTNYSIIDCRCAFNGGARGRRWATAANGMFITGHNLDTYLPGDLVGNSLDGTGTRL